MGIIQEKQPLIFKQFVAAFEKKRLSHAYMFEGPSGTGKEEMAIWLSKKVFCLSPLRTEPCGECRNCSRIEIGEHPDVTMIRPEGQSIKVEQIREIKATFVRSGMETAQKILLVHEAEKMTVSAANSLLKYIEEPDGQIIIIFLTTAKARMLSTIQSRCQIIHFLPLPEDTFQKELISSKVSKNDAILISQLTNSYEKAIEISQDEWFNDAKIVSEKWVDYLTKKNPFAFVFVQQQLIKTFSEKEQQFLFFDIVLSHFRTLLAKTIYESESLSGESFWTKEKQVGTIEEILTSRKKFSANVGFQNVCEQLSLKILKS